MELVDGPTSAERIANGAVPLDEALADREADRAKPSSTRTKGHHPPRSQARQRQAHADGGVKVLDFGLAKACPTTASASGSDLIKSPTLTARVDQARA